MRIFLRTCARAHLASSRLPAFIATCPFAEKERSTRTLRFIALGTLLAGTLAIADAETYRVVVPKPGFMYRNDFGQQLTYGEVREQSPDATWNIHSTLSIYDGEEKIAEYTSPNMTLDRPEAFSERGIAGTRIFYRNAGSSYEFDTAHGFAYVDGTFSDVNPPTGERSVSEGHGINDHGVSVGIFGIGAYRYVDGAASTMALLVGTSNAFGINNRDEATGWLIEEGLWSAFLYRPASSQSSASMVKIGYLDTTHSYSAGAAINDLGQIVGVSAVGAYDPNFGSYENKHAFLYGNGSMIDLGTLGSNSSSATSLNDSGTVVGTSRTVEGHPHAFVYRNGQMADLNSLIDPADPLAGLEFSTAYHINQDGVISVLAQSGDAKPTRYLLIPDPDPGVDTAYYNFEHGAQDWGSNGEPIVDVATSSEKKFAGERSLAIQINDAGFASVAVFSPPVRPGKTLTFHVYIPGDAHIDWVQPFAQEGEAGNWNWHGNWTSSEGLQIGAWNTITVDVPADAKPLNAIGLEFFASQAGGAVFLDSVDYGATSDNAPYNFENGTQDWQSSGSFASVSTSSAQRFAGESALAITVNNSTFASVQAPNPAIPPGRTISFHIYLAPDAPVDSIQPYAQEGAAGNWNWHGAWTPREALRLGAWNTITVDVPADSQAIESIGLQLSTSQPYAGTVYLDSVNF